MTISTATQATAFQQTQLANTISVSVASKTLSAQKQAGAAALKLLDSATGEKGEGNEGGGLDVNG